jgi:hypothetical protein
VTTAGHLNPYSLDGTRGTWIERACVALLPGSPDPTKDRRIDEAPVNGSISAMESGVSRDTGCTETAQYRRYPPGVSVSTDARKACTVAFRTSASDSLSSTYKTRNGPSRAPGGSAERR